MAFFGEVPVSATVELCDLESAASLWRRQVEARATLGDVDMDADVMVCLGNEPLRLDVATVLNIEHAIDVTITVLHSCIGRSELKNFGISMLLPSDLGEHPEFYVAIVQFSNRGVPSKPSSHVFVTGEDNAASILKVLCAVTEQSIL